MTTRLNIISIEKQMLALNVLNQVTNTNLNEYQHDILVGVIATLQEMKDNLESEEVIGFLNITTKDLPASLIKKIQDNEFYTYMNTYDLLEHLYSVDSIIEKAQEAGIILNKEETKALNNLQGRMNDKNCGYFRIVTF